MVNLTNKEVAQRWFDIQLGHPPYPNAGYLSNSALDSYPFALTSWSERLVEMYKDGRGVRVILINGQRGDIGTAQHQAMVRKMADASGKPWVSIPFNTITQSGIIKESIRLVDKTEDEFWGEDLTQFELPPGTRLVQPQQLVAHTGVWRHRVNGAELLQEPKGSVGWDWVQPRYEDDPDREEILIQTRGWAEWKMTKIGDITSYSRTVQHHRLGAAVIRAKVYMGSSRNARVATFLSGWDDHESPPAYFLAELPASAGSKLSVAEAYEALKPDVVRLAENMGREVRRQGDIFVVKMSEDFNGKVARLLDTSGIWIRTQQHILHTNHMGKRVIELDGQTYVSGKLIHQPGWRRPDHRDVLLDNGWWLAKKNTVPKTREPR